MKPLSILVLIAVCSTTAAAAIVNDNCASDQSAQIQVAIDARTGNVALPAGCIAVSRPIYAKDWVSLQGAGRRLTTLKALPTFKGPALVIVGTGLPADAASGHQLVFDSMVSDLFLNVEDAPAGTSCAYVGGAQQGSGMQRDLCWGVKGATSDAIRITGNVNRADFRELEIYPVTAIRYGIVSENAFCGCEMANITIGVTNPLIAGIRISDAVFIANRIHCEYAENCVQVNGNNSVGVITSVDGPTAVSTSGYLVFVAAGPKVVAQGLVKNGYAGNIRSLSDPGIDRADPYIAEILINN